jgi:hypothetical protein
MPKPPPSLPERISRRIAPSASGCWEWLGAHDRHGYGTTTACDRKVGAHRVVYEALVGPIPAGLVIDHLCRNRGCVNPSHMEPVTDRVNKDRGIASPTKTHCVHGHEFTPENTRHSQGRRNCRACDRRRQAESKARRRTKTLAVTS